MKSRTLSRRSSSRDQQRRSFLSWLRPQPQKSSAGRKLRFESLEDRRLLAIVTVTGTGDTIAVDGLVTLREAITSANNNANVNTDVVGIGAYGTDTINFNIAGAGVQTISLTSALRMTDTVIIDGYTQPVARPNTLAVGNDAVLLIEINGAGAGPAAQGLFEFFGGGGSTVRGLVINRGPTGIPMFNIGLGIASNNNTIAGNFIGTDATGAVFLGGSTVIEVSAGTGNTIGGTTPQARNVTVGGAGNGTIEIQPGGSGTLVQGNYIGLNAAGTAALQPPTTIGINAQGTRVGQAPPSSTHP